jgi:hypothetical protein
MCALGEAVSWPRALCRHGEDVLGRDSGADFESSAIGPRGWDLLPTALAVDRYAVHQKIPRVGVSVDRPDGKANVRSRNWAVRSAHKDRRNPRSEAATPFAFASRAAEGPNGSKAGRTHGQCASEWKPASSRASSAWVGCGSPPVTACQNDTGYASTRSGCWMSSCTRTAGTPALASHLATHNSLSTLWHLRDVYAKLGITSRRELRRAYGTGVSKG